MYTANVAAQGSVPAAATLLSPKFETDDHQCVQFAYIFGGNSNISLLLFGTSEVETSKEQLLWKVNAMTAIYSGKWKETEAFLPTGFSRLKFVVQYYSGTHGVGIDDVHVMSAPCPG